jgi:hypothetical protein
LSTLHSASPNKEKVANFQQSQITTAKQTFFCFNAAFEENSLPSLPAMTLAKRSSFSLLFFNEA